MCELAIRAHRTRGFTRHASINTCVKYVLLYKRRSHVITCALYHMSWFGAFTNALFDYLSVPKEWDVSIPTASILQHSHPQNCGIVEITPLRVVVHLPYQISDNNSIERNESFSKYHRNTKWGRASNAGSYNRQLHAAGRGSNSGSYMPVRGST